MRCNLGVPIKTNTKMLAVYAADVCVCHNADIKK